MPAIGSTDTRRRLISAAAVVLVICAGLAARHWLPQPFAEHVGNVLWAVMWYAIVLTILPRLRALHAAIVSFAICAAIEFGQLTSIPDRAAAVVPLSRWLLGSGFDWQDFVGNALGSLAAYLITRGYAGKR